MKYARSSTLDRREPGYAIWRRGGRQPMASKKKVFFTISDGRFRVSVFVRFEALNECACVNQCVSGKKKQSAGGRGFCFSRTTHFKKWQLPPALRSQQHLPVLELVAALPDPGLGVVPLGYLAPGQARTAEKGQDEVPCSHSPHTHMHTPLNPGFTTILSTGKKKSAQENANEHTHTSYPPFPVSPAKGR